MEWYTATTHEMVLARQYLVVDVATTSLVIILNIPHSGDAKRHRSVPDEYPIFHIWQLVSDGFVRAAL
jgi:hypothetical protein